MPPYVSRKRHSSPATETPPPKRLKHAVRGKSSVFDAVDSHKASKTSAEDTRAYLEQLDDESDSSSNDDEDSSEDGFEDVPGIRADASADDSTMPVSRDEEAEEDEDMDWEDAIEKSKQSAHQMDIDDVTISVTENGTFASATDRAASTLRKGPSNRERLVRKGTHCLHVQSLVWHNAIRNSWLNDAELHKILLDGLPEGIRIEIDRFRADMGMTSAQTLSRSKKRLSAKSKKKGTTNRTARDWEHGAEQVEIGVVNKSGGDPTLRLLKFMTAYWRKRFTVVAPGIRKLGYMPIKRLAQEINSWKKDRLDVERHGERVEDKNALRKLAKSCEGSRDVGSQLFTALMRALGLEARMVANIQPAGIGWGKAEEAKSVKATSAPSDPQTNGTTGLNDKKSTGKTPPKKSKRKIDKAPAKASKIISLDSDDDSSLSSAPSDLEDDDSIVDVTDLYQKKRPKKKYDRDMFYPNYWTEVLSPISNTYIPVDPMVLSTVATNAELVATFEPRGKRAEQAKQVICYTVAHYSDGTAKDVTVRYLKKHQLPGRTKGYRLPIEKIKVYNKKGKVTKYEDYEWFKTVISIFARPHNKRTVADDLEEATDLKPFKPETEKGKPEMESLQWYKQSAEFVLERHLRREEAILPTAEPVRTFAFGKGDKMTEEPVFNRSDVVACKTAESWHKEGREIKFGEQPMKLVPMRAVTMMRKREMEEVERETGEKAKQGLFSRNQTDWIIPSPIGEDREIPRNAFGNIDVYVPSMVPEGAVHLRLKGTAKICRDLGISHAEACTGFEFGKRMAIPVITGVVIAKENKRAVVELWKEREAERQRKEDIKRTERCLTIWRKFCTGLRIMERMRREYADTGVEEDINPFVRKGKAAGATVIDLDGPNATEKDEEGGGGGFLLPDDDIADVDMDDEDELSAEHNIDLEGGGFLIEEDDTTPAVSSPAAKVPGKTSKPLSLKAAHERLSDFAFDQRSLDGEESQLSELSESDAPLPSKAPVKKEKTATPARRPPRKATENAKTSSGTGSARSVQSARKAAPRGARTSKYFAKNEDGGSEDEVQADRDAGDDDGEDEQEEDEEEEEVIRPRRTTARTRARKA
ncbi:hypothetical protein ANO11243_062670 [Dothideomycetidae sp. 11243]|nr:hypothetical protein ANO11243_062670 [fungal sp. No.11243]